MDTREYCTLYILRPTGGGSRVISAELSRMGVIGIGGCKLAY